jgi:hypothetical protein
LRDVLAREVEFMAKVGELTAGERESLMEQGELAIKRREALFNPMNPVGQRVAVVVNGLNQMRQVRHPDTPDQAVRRELTLVLKAISHDAWEKFDAARERLDHRRRRAEVLAQVAAFDETLLLTRDQREKLYDLLCEPWTQMWRRRGNDGAAADPIQLGLNVSQAFDLFDIPEAWRKEILRPSQEAAYKVIQLPASLETVFAGEAPQPDQAGQNGAAVQIRIRALGVQQAPRKIVRHGLPLAEERQRLQSLVERLIEDVDVQADLDEAQIQKLLLAGKLDIDRHFQRYATSDVEEGSPDKVVGTIQTQVAGATVRLPPIFSDPDSFYQKALHGRLSPEQSEKLAEAYRERGRFHRLVVLAALTVALTNRAALTDVQAEQVEEWLSENLAAVTDADDPLGSRRATIELLSGLHPDALKPLVDDWQWPAVREYVKELAEKARALETPPAHAPGADVEEMLLGIPVQP